MGNRKIKGVFLANPDGFRIGYVFGSGRRKRYEETLDLCPDLICRENLEKHRAFLRETEVMIATWEMPRLTEEEIEQYFPKLKLLLYVAGSVQKFARAYLQRGVRVASAWGVMSIPVAEWTVSAIIHANKGFYQSLAIYKQKPYEEAHWRILTGFPGTYHTKVGILGAGMIGSRVIEMLQAYDTEVMVFDPFLSEEKAKRLKIEKTYSLEEIFEECQTISNHLANNPHTVHMLNGTLFARMKPNGTFINSGRGAQVVEEDLIRALKEEPARTAILDVTWPEQARKEFLTMPNVFCTPHIAGFAAEEVLRMADVMLNVLREYLDHGRLICEVTEKMLETMA